MRMNISADICFKKRTLSFFHFSPVDRALFSILCYNIILIISLIYSNYSIQVFEVLQYCIKKYLFNLDNLISHNKEWYTSINILIFLYFLNTLYIFFQYFNNSTNLRDLISLSFTDTMFPVNFSHMSVTLQSSLKKSTYLNFTFYRSVLHFNMFAPYIWDPRNCSIFIYRSEF